MAEHYRQYYFGTNASRISLYCWHLPFVTAAASQQAGRPGPRYHCITLHGFTGNGLDWQPLTDLPDNPLQARWTAPDWCGHGHSSAPNCLEDFANCLRAAVAMVAPGEQLVFVAYSMGGRLLLHLLARHPEWRPFPCVFIGVNPGIESEQERALRRLGDDRWREILQLQTIDQFAGQWEAQAILRSQNSIAPHYLRAMQKRRRALNRSALDQVLRLSGQGALPSAWPSLATAEQPMLWLYGSADEKYAVIARQAAARSKLATSAAIQGAGHSAHLEQPQTTATIILRWLELTPRT